MRYTYTEKPPLGSVLDRNKSISKGLTEGWMFNEYAGTTYNNFASNNALTASGLAVSIDKSVKIRQTPTYSWLSSNEDFLGGLSQCSLVVRFSFEGNQILDTTRQRIFGAQRQGEIYWLATTGDIRRFTGYFYNSVGALLQLRGTTEPAVPNKFYTVALVYDGAELKLYVEGILVDSGPFTGTIRNSTGPFYLGRIHDNSISWLDRGSIDFCCTYNRALSTSEVMDLTLNPYQVVEDLEISLSYVGRSVVPVVPLSIPYTEKPPMGSVLDSNKPISQGMIEGFMFNEYTGLISNSLVTSNVLTSTPPTANGNVTSVDKSIKFTVNTYGNNAYMLMPVDVLGGLSQCTVILKVNFYNVGIISRFLSQGNGLYPIAMWMDPVVNPANRFWIHLNTSTGYVQVKGQTEVPIVGKSYTVALVYDGTLMTLYVEGVPVSSAPHSGTVNFDSLTTPELYLGRVKNDSSTNMAGSMDYIYFYDRALSISEVMDLTVNPYQVVEDIYLSGPVIVTPPPPSTIPVVPLSIPYTEKPPMGSVPDRNKAITKGLIEGFLLNEYAYSDALVCKSFVSSNVLTTANPITTLWYEDKHLRFKNSPLNPFAQMNADVMGGLSQCTVIMRFSLDLISRRQRLMGTGFNDQCALFWLAPSGDSQRFSGYFKNSLGSRPMVSGTTEIPIINKFYTIALTYDGANVVLHVEGVPVGSVALTGTIIAEPIFYLGRIAGDSGSWLSGAIDYCYIYDRPLSTYELMSLTVNPYQVVEDIYLTGPVIVTPPSSSVVIYRRRRRFVNSGF